ncbi:BTAD domain-containing putative transcriptional regulator [Faecalispora anaeroviscerum]|uniref:BTAD domain-containing putative transcriptional regulator n=1 Tax=Faecalispora anaeroviscerum TaxID=2991836 RepID=UPI0024BA9F22|nr:BTAD domain-containing putative transcriptional regulator [Faecalispora anaeroviscerum]
MAQTKPESETIWIHTLGKFSIQRGEHVLTQSNGKPKQVWLLIEYLIANRNAHPRIEHLIQALWADSRSCTDPMNALKNLVYRARDLLKKGLQDSDTEFIIYSQGSYLWNPELHCVVDEEELQRLSALAGLPGQKAMRQIALYQQAVSQYQGDFLPNSSYAPWVISHRKELTGLYLQSVRSLCLLLEETQEYGELIALCESAITLVPFEESLHKYLTGAYLRTGQNNKALAHYQYVTELFYRELGVNISANLRDLYRQITKTVHQTELDLSVIKDSLREEPDDDGAYYCDYEIFRNLYRIQARCLKRTGQSIIVALMTLMDDNGMIVNGSEAVAAVNLFREVVVHSLRKGDAVAAYSSSQFIIMLPLTNLENAEGIMQRITRKFESSYKKKDFKIIFTLRPIEPLEK